MAADHALEIARTYHDAWTGRDFDRAAALLAGDLEVEVPINDYPTTDSFVAALRGFGSLATNVQLLSAMAGSEEAMLLYDLDVAGLGRMRVAEHFTVAGGRIVRLRQIHDTAELRAAGFAGAPGMAAGSAGDAAGYRATVRYRAPVADVYDAAARPGGPTGWWSTSGDVVTGAGAPLRLNWSGDDHVVFRVDRAERPAVMRWTCVEQHDGSLEPPDEWVGTTLSFAFADEGGTTRLDFVHHGLVPQLACFGVCERGWDFFLRRSLKQLVEAGEGLPYRAQ